LEFRNLKISKLSLLTTPIEQCPFQFHTAAMAVFASVIAPFGGFFASGFKRAFKIKDFGDMIPGHGGLMGKISKIKYKNENDTKMCTNNI